MEPIIVDGDLCTLCGICSVVCPSVITVAGYDGGLPLVGREYAAICLQCGHFQAFCPTGVLTLNLRPEERMPCRRTRARSPRRRSLSILKKLRSIRHFTGGPIQRTDLGHPGHRPLCGFRGQQPAGALAGGS